MNILTTQKVFPFLVFSVFLMAGCGGGTDMKNKRAGINEVIVHESGDIDKMNPFTSTSANGGYAHDKVFQGLLDVAPEAPFEYVPVLAESRPTIIELDSGEYAGGLEIRYTIREEAVWDNGEPITADDAIFSLKAIKNPKVDCEHLRGYYEFIKDIVKDPADDKKLTIYCDSRYFQAEIWSALTILPEHIYDPKKLMRNFSLKDLSDPAKKDELNSDPLIIEFANEFNSEKYQREKGYVVGSGPYKFVEWKTGQRLILEKKDDWWGEQFSLLDDEQALAKEGIAFSGFEAGPDKIIFEVINDAATSINALKNQDLDVMRGVRAKDFVKLRDNDEYQKVYNFATPKALQYNYIGMNMKIDKLSDKKVRQALSMLIDREYIINTLYYGLADPISGPVLPAKSYYNKNLEPYAYDIEEAKALLDEAGWKDTDGDGVRDKMIGGKKVSLNLNVKYPSGSSTGAKLLLTFQENAGKAGVKIEPVAREWTVMIDETKTHEFEMFLGGWVSAPVDFDPKQIWHTQSYNGGSNYVGFGNAESDQLIENIRYEIDPQKRHDMYLRFQEIVNEQAPYIFLFSSLSRLAIHNRFDNADGLVKRPGYYTRGFKLNPSFGAAKQASVQ